MYKLYVPDYTPTLYPCVVYQGQGQLRAYHEIPRNNASIDYTTFWSLSHYDRTNGTQNFSNISTLPTCISQTMLTNEIYYRHDIDSILISFAIIAYIGIYLPYKIFMGILEK